jgi:hypothetical protein
MFFAELQPARTLENVQKKTRKKAMLSVRVRGDSALAVALAESAFRCRDIEVLAPVGLLLLTLEPDEDPDAAVTRCGGKLGEPPLLVTCHTRPAFQFVFETSLPARDRAEEVAQFLGVGLRFLSPTTFVHSPPELDVLREDRVVILADGREMTVRATAVRVPWTGGPGQLCDICFENEVAGFEVEHASRADGTPALPHTIPVCQPCVAAFARSQASPFPSCPCNSSSLLSLETLMVALRSDPDRLGRLLDERGAPPTPTVNVAVDDATRRKIEEITKPCPNCKVRIEKSEGCSHMTCTRCKHEFYWCCARPWRDPSSASAHRESCG